MIRSGILLILTAFLAACTYHPSLPSRAAAAPTPYHLSLGFSSALPSTYTVTTGPMQTYQGYPVNAWARALLDEEVTRRSSAESGESAEVNVRLLSLKTTYHEMGQVRRHTSPGRVRLALASAAVGPSGEVFVDDFDGHGDGGERPYLVIKKAFLRAEVQIRSPGRTLAHQTVEVEATDQVRYDDVFPHFYDYDRVLLRVLHHLVRQVDGLITQTLGVRSGQGG